MSVPKPHRPFALRALNAAGRQLRALGWRVPTLDPERLLRAARRATGLDDFGGDHFREGLGVLLHALEQEAQLNTVGRMMAHQNALNYLKNRLQLQETRVRHPEIADEPTRRPIFILGLPRTGTTILFNLLAEDPANRAALGWEIESPCPPPAEGVGADDPRVARAQAGFDYLNKLAPTLSTIHEFGALLPQECIAITGHEFMSVGLLMLYDIPSYRDWLDRQSQVPALHTHRRFLQHLQFGSTERRWVGKTPGHLPAIEDLLEVYPDACIIHMHRDPLRVMPSTTSLAYALRGIGSDAADPHQVGRQQLDLWGRNLNRALEARDRLRDDQGRFFDTQFEDVVRDPVGLIARIYEFFDLPFSDEARTCMETYLRANPRDKHGVHRYSLEDFGLDRERDGPRFERYCRRFDIPTDTLL
jgi:hypothetical protein